eukprot:12891031-Prorocentrum_lima.AAC.1
MVIARGIVGETTVPSLRKRQIHDAWEANMQQKGEKLPHIVKAAPAKATKSRPRKPRGDSPRSPSPKGGKAK